MAHSRDLDRRFARSDHGTAETTKARFIEKALLPEKGGGLAKRNSMKLVRFGMPFDLDDIDC